MTLQMDDTILAIAEQDSQPPKETHPDVWHTGCNGPRQAILRRLYPLHGRAVIEFHGALELVDSSYFTPGDAVALAWAVERIKELEALIKHCQTHSGFRDCGSSQMDSDMRQLYDSIVSREIE